LNRNHRRGPELIQSYDVLDEGGSPTEFRFVQSLTRGSFYVTNIKDDSTTLAPHQEEGWEGFPKKPKRSNVPRMEYHSPNYARRPGNDDWTHECEKIRVVTNVFDAKSPIGNYIVYRYNVTFDKLDPTEVEARTFVLNPKNKDERNEIMKQMKEHFGCWAFDNIVLYCFGKPKSELPPAVSLTFKSGAQDHMLTFDMQNNHIEMGETGEDISEFPAEQQEQLLNVFKKAKVESAGFTCLRGEFFKRRGYEDSKVVGNFRMRFGYDCAVRLNSDGQMVFVADLCCRLLHNLSIGQQAESIRSDFGGDQAGFEKQCTRKFLGRSFIPKYNTRSYKIVGLDFKSNECTTFDRNGTPMRFKDYINNQYGVKANKQEDFLLVDEDGSKFLPQLCFLTARSEESRAVYKTILDELNVEIGRRLERVRDFVAEVNRGDDSAYKEKIMRRGWNSGSSADLVISETSIETDAVCFSMPQILFEGKFGKKERGSVDNFRWSSTGGINNQLKIGNMTIVFTNPRHERDANNLIKQFDTYLKMRKFKLNSEACPFTERPNVVKIDGRNLEPKSYKKIRQMLPPETEAVVVILPDGDDGSRVKTHFTNAFQRESSCGTDQPIVLQCIQRKNAGNKNAVIGSLEDLVGKMEGELFRIQPSLRTTYIKLDNVWTMGTATTTIDKKTVSNTCLNTKPFSSSLAGKTFRCNPNLPKITIMPYANALTVYMELLEEQVKLLIENGLDKKLPSTIFFFRDGVPDNSMRELFSKEVVSLQRAIHDLRDKYKLRGRWKCKIEFMVFQTRIRDKFGEVQKSGRVAKPKQPCAIYARLPSSRFWDFVVYPNTKSKYGKPVRWIVLMDQEKLAEKSPMDLLNFVYALHWTYGFSIPFPQGCCSVPNEIQLSKKYAEIHARSIMKEDLSVRDTKISEKLKSRTLPITEIIDTTLPDPTQIFCAPETSI